MDEALREILRQLATEAPEVYNVLQLMLSGNYSRGELRSLALGVINMARNHPMKSAILRALAMILRLLGISTDIIAGGTAVGGVAGGTATAGGVAGGSTATGAAGGATTVGGATGGATSAGGTAATGGASAAAITAATVAAVAVLVVEIFSLINAIKLLEAKKNINRVTDQINQTTMDGLNQLRESRDAGNITEVEYKAGVDQVIQAFSDALNQLESINSECQDALDENILIGIGEWFSGVFQQKQNFSVPLKSENNYRVGYLEYESVIDKFSSIGDESGMALSSHLADLRRSTTESAVQPVFEFFQEQGMNEEQDSRYRNLCLRAARYFSAPGGNEVMRYWRNVYNSSPSNTLARKQAVLSSYGSHSDEARELLHTALQEDADPVVRVLSYEIFGANLRIRYDLVEKFLELLSNKLSSRDNAARLGIVYSIAMMPYEEFSLNFVNKLISILENLIGVEKNYFIAGAALNVLSNLVSEKEFGKYAPEVQELTKLEPPTLTELLVSVLNNMAVIGDKEGFLILSEHPTEIDVGEVKVEALFRNAPYAEAEDILQVKGIGKKTLEVMSIAVRDNLMGSGVDLATLPTLPLLRQVVRKKIHKEILNPKDLLLAIINFLSQDGQAETLELLTENPEQIDVGPIKISRILEMAPFDTVEDLDAVKGIGLRTIEAMAGGLIYNLKRVGWDTNSVPGMDEVNDIKNALMEMVK